MRGRSFIVFLVFAASCGNFIGTDGEPAPTPAADGGTSSSSGGADAGSATADGSVVVVTPKTCTTSRECPSHQCQPDDDGKAIRTGTCVEGGSCKFFVNEKDRPIVDDHCEGVVPCLGFTCVPSGIVPGPTGIFACGIPGDGCKDIDGARCCYTECVEGVCAQP